MELRLPGSGTLGEFMRGAIVDGLTPDTSYTRWRDTDRTFYGVDPQDVIDAIDLVAGRQMEYVGLADGPVEIQAADVPDGFVIQRSFGDEFILHPDTLDLYGLRAAFLAFLEGDVDGGLTWPEPPPRPARKKRGLFRRG